ncbi:hypothetical protein [Arthrobacter sp. NPDC056493]|uniref:hypothetical protein n=1 Tax=Arthrobacter sp. NPDC056493 TaxID=3345839 RepID=UPI0036721B27
MASNGRSAASNAKSNGQTVDGARVKTVFVISPIGKPSSPEHRAAKLVLDYLIKKVFLEPEWKVVRADDENAPDSITTQVIDRIVNSELIVADLTDHNPNVFYELAVAHGYQRPVIQIMKEGQSPPFDVVDQRVIFYDLTDPASVEAAKESIAASAEWLADHSDQIRSPLTAHGSFTAISNAGPGDGANEAIASALTEIVTRLGRLERAQRNSKPEREDRLRLSDLSAESIRDSRQYRMGRERFAALTNELEMLDAKIAELTSKIDFVQNDKDAPADTRDRIVRDLREELDAISQRKSELTRVLAEERRELRFG